MAITQTADDDVLNNIIKKSLIGIKPKEKIEVLTEKSIVKVSNTITSLQNAYNKIYAFTLNVKNVHKLEEKRLQGIKKEVTMETKTSTASFAGGMSIDIGNLPDVFKQLTKSVEDLTKNLDKLDMSAPDSTGDVDIDDDTKSKKRTRGGRKAKSRGRIRGKGLGRALGALGAVLDVTDRVGEGQSAGQVAAGVGGGMAGGYAGASAGAALGALGGPAAAVTVPLGALVGGALGYMGGSALGDKAYSVATNKGPQRQLENATKNVTQQQTKLEKGTPLGSTSFSSRFADYLNQSVNNMSTWALAASPMLASFAAAGSLGGAFGDYFGGEGAGSTANAETAMQYFMSQGWTRAQAAGIVGNLQGESGANLNPNAYRANDAGPGRHSYGIAQWNRERWAGLQAHAQRAGKPWNDFQTQLQYVQHELMNSEKAVGSDLSGAQDAGAAAAIMSRYERYAGYRLGIASPETRKRIANANALLNRGTTAAGSIDRSGGGVGTISSLFGRRARGDHKGIDIAAPAGTPVAAAATGRIIRAEYSNSYGNVVYIDHGNGQNTRYGHLKAFAAGVRNGAQVKAGDIIGSVGNTGQSRGNHLHYELLINGQQVDPLQSYQSRRWIVGGKIKSIPAPAPKPPAPSPTLGQRLDNAVDYVTSIFTGGNAAPPAKTPNTGSAAFNDAQRRK